MAPRRHLSATSAAACRLIVIFEGGRR
jgi:hypothetical protein